MLALSDEEAEHEGERLWSIKAASEGARSEDDSGFEGTDPNQPFLVSSRASEESQSSLVAACSEASVGTEREETTEDGLTRNERSENTATDESVAESSTTTSPVADPGLLRQDSAQSFASSSSSRVEGSGAMPEVLTLTPDVWALLQQEATACWTSCVDAACTDPVKAFRSLGESFRCAPLGPRSDVDVGVAQLMKDIKREIVVVNGTRYIVATQFDSLYKDLAQLLTQVQPDLANTRALDHRVQRILRACSRTVSGYDSYRIMVALMENCTPRCMVTPGMMDNSPIMIETEQASMTIISVNIFKLVTEVIDGSVVTMLAVRLDLTEQISFQDWTSTRWLRLEPLDKVQDSLSLISKFRDNFKALVEDEDGYTSDAELRGKLASMVDKLDDVILRSTSTVRRLVKEEYTRGASEANHVASKGDNPQPLPVEAASNPVTLASAPKTIASYFRRIN